MSGFHLGMEQQNIIIGFQLSQFCHPFGWLPILDLGIVQAGGDQHVRVIFWLHIVIRRVREHVVVIFLDIRIAPFVVF